jgi:hypothetical protein
VSLDVVLGEASPHPGQTEILPEGELQRFARAVRHADPRSGFPHTSISCWHLRHVRIDLVNLQTPEIMSRI